jgi:hypothetical protein
MQFRQRGWGLVPGAPSRHPKLGVRRHPLACLEGRSPTLHSLVPLPLVLPRRSTKRSRSHSAAIGGSARSVARDRQQRVPRALGLSRNGPSGLRADRCVERLLLRPPPWHVRLPSMDPAIGEGFAGAVQTLSRKVGRCDRQSVLDALGIPTVTCPQVQRIRDQSPPFVNR